MISTIKNIKLTKRATLIFAFATAAGLAVFSLTAGAGDVTTKEAFAVIGDKLGLVIYEGRANIPVLIWELRLPRTLLALLLGAALGVAGCITQGLFRNPLAAPGILGISSGASLFVVIGYSLGLAESQVYAAPLLAALGSCSVLVVLFFMSKSMPGVMSLLLGGLALSTLLNAVLSLLLSAQMHRYELTVRAMQWIMGSFDGRSWPHVQWAILPVMAGFWAAFYLRRGLDVILLGYDTAESLGISRNSLMGLSIFSISLLAGSATAMIGAVAFVGLIIPHIVRMVAGPMHSVLIPGSAIFGGIFLLTVDIVSRHIESMHVPPGVITGIIGGPFFFWLIWRHKGGER